MHFLWKWSRPLQKAGTESDLVIGRTVQAYSRGLKTQPCGDSVVVGQTSWDCPCCCIYRDMGGIVSPQSEWNCLTIRINHMITHCCIFLVWSGLVHLLAPPPLLSVLINKTIVHTGFFWALKQTGSLSRVYPTSLPMTAGIVSSTSHETELEEQKKMDGRMLLTITKNTSYVYYDETSVMFCTNAYHRLADFGKSGTLSHVKESFQRLSKANFFKLGILQICFYKK